jgi:peptidoglycan/xylan/chitin deacetylase (PgdA/CDA1 family)
VNWSVPGTIILLYHRVAELETDPQLLCVSRRHFREHLEILRKHAPLIGLTDLARSLQEGSAPRRAAVITFDDGYTDNLTNARPILERHDAQATVFVATGQTGQHSEFWWDELERLLLHGWKLPASLTLDVDGEKREFLLGDEASFTPHEWRLNRRWNVEHTGDPSARYRVYRELCDVLRPLSAPVRAGVVAQLQLWSDRGDVGRKTHRAMTCDELCKLASSELVQIGAHTVSHAFLAAQPLDVQHKEIQRSKAALETMLGTGVSSFSYPFGYRAAYTPATIGILKDANFSCACSNFGGLVYDDTDRFQLPRFLVRDWDGDEFARRLHMFLTRRARCRGPALVH